MQKHFLPCAVTTFGACLGFLSCVATLRGDFHAAALFLFGAMFVDALDGRLARKLEAVSEIGREFDSLSDSLCFGLAPCLLYSALYFDGGLGSLLMMPYLASVIIRLARFNVTPAGSDFVGLPSPAAAATLITFSLLPNVPALVPVGVSWFLAGLMLCNFKYPKKIGPVGLGLTLTAAVLGLVGYASPAWTCLLVACLGYVVPFWFSPPQTEESQP